MAENYGRNMKTPIVDILREKYPEPRVRRSVIRGGYSVGGALCMHTGLGCHFPRPPMIAEALEHANPLLDGYDSLAYAKLILEMNDMGDFLTAWNLMDEAVNLRH